ncbi:MAG: hypothetical protein GWO23_20130, partial [Gammaproteobacteria bacterium]|nr:hypothetical protein [Gammaproteobacteria bacterium]NIW47374.1 hypothetical protein [Gammaproteobacteria bacterium]
MAKTDQDKTKANGEFCELRRKTDAPKPTKQMLTINDVARLLHHRNRISDEQYQMILEQAEAQAARLNAQLPKGKIKKDVYNPDIASPAQVITSFNLEIPATKKKLTEDMITEMIAQASGMEYIKIDPLKLQLDVVTDQ